MASEILQELEENVSQMRVLMGNQKFTTADAEKYLERYYNIVRKMEDLETSRDLWRDKFKEVKNCSNCELCLTHAKGGKK